jgi:hypothetical protein
LPRDSAPERAERDFVPTGRVGGLWIPEPKQGALVRAALGRRDGDRFRALAVASELALRPGAAEPRFRPLGFDAGRQAAVEERAAAYALEHRG